MLYHPTCRDQPRIIRQHERSQPGHGITEMIDVNDLAQIVWPVCPAMRVILARLTRRRLAARQQGGNRCKEIAAVIARRPSRAELNNSWRRARELGLKFETSTFEHC